MIMKTVHFRCQLLTVDAVCQESTTDTECEDWLLMFDNEKALYVLTAMDGMQKEGVMFFGKSPNEYIRAIDKRLKDNSDLASTDLLKIVAPIIYESMPGYEEEVDKIRK